MEESSYTPTPEFPVSRKATAIGDKHYELAIEHPLTSIELPIYRKKKPKFVGKGYLPLILRDTLKGKPVKSIRKAGVSSFMKIANSQNTS